MEDSGKKNEPRHLALGRLLFICVGGGGMESETQPQPKAKVRPEEKHEFCYLPDQFHLVGEIPNDKDIQI